MNKLTETIASLKPKSGEIFVIIGSRRYFLASCKVTIDIKRCSTQVNVVGQLNANYKNTFASVVFCLDPARSERFNAGLAEQVEAYEIICEFQSGIDEGERVKLEKFVSADVDFFSNEWVFEIEDADTIRKLLRFT